MSWAIVPAAKKCPICGSWDTVLESPDITRSMLYCCCGTDTQRLVWSDELQDGGTTIERTHHPDGSVEESTVVYPLPARSTVIESIDCGRNEQIDETLTIKETLL